MTIKKAHELLDQEYKKALEKPFVLNPLAFALYQVWKRADEQNGRLRGTADER